MGQAPKELDHESLLVWFWTKANRWFATSVELFRGADSILSGPAGGVVGASRLAEATGRRRVLAFDMGGTSTDVARLDGRLEREFETVKAGVRSSKF